MNTVLLRHISIGNGMPKLCLPIVGNTQEEICRQASHCLDYPFDLIEWRADWFSSVHDLQEVAACAVRLRQILGDTPLLFTFRTKEEGGERSISDLDYIRLNAFVAQHRLADAIDVELFRGDDVVRTMIAQAHECETAVVVSNHNFFETPPQNEILSRLLRAQELGGDILKIAVMPQSAQDVLTLLSATQQAHQVCTQPLITMSMGQLGVISRMAGETFGSSVTFGAAGLASAPGQIPADTLQQILNTVHGFPQ